MRLVLALISLIAFSACGPAAVPSARAPASAGARTHTLRLMFVGSSITTGFFASAADRTYPQLVVDALRRAGRPVRPTILAESGATVDEALRWAVGSPADAVVIQLGTNDYGDAVPLSTFSGGYTELVTRIHAVSPRARLLCLGGWDASENPNRVGLTGGQYDAATRKACAGAAGTFVDLSALYADPDNHGPVGRFTFLGLADWFHPNDRGHQRLADLVTARLPARG